MVAPWFPLHLMSTEHARAVAASFLEVFPAAALWIAPLNRDRAGVPQQGKEDYWVAASVRNGDAGRRRCRAFGESLNQ